MKRPLAYITAPWGDNQYENAENAADYCRQVYDAGYSPVCPVLFLPAFLKDEIPQEHKDGLDMARDYPFIAEIIQRPTSDTLQFLVDENAGITPLDVLWQFAAAIGFQLLHHIWAELGNQIKVVFGCNGIISISPQTLVEGAAPKPL